MTCVPIPDWKDHLGKISEIHTGRYFLLFWEALGISFWLYCAFYPLFGSSWLYPYQIEEISEPFASNTTKPAYECGLSSGQSDAFKRRCTWLVPDLQECKMLSQKLVQDSIQLQNDVNYSTLGLPAMVGCNIILLMYVKLRMKEQSENQLGLSQLAGDCVSKDM